MRCQILLSLLLVSACGAASSDVEADEAALAAPPAPFALQFTGTYQDALLRLTLRRDGSFLAVTDSGAEHGRFYSSPASRTLPLELRFRGKGRWTAVIEAYDGRLRVLRGADEQVLQLLRPQTSDEELCDRTGGRWTDDDADPATGLYCVCAAGSSFVPAEGGCVR